MIFADIFLASLGGVIEAIAGKSIEAGPALARRVRLLGMVERQPASAAEQAEPIHRIGWAAFAAQPIDFF